MADQRLVRSELERKEMPPLGPAERRRNRLRCRQVEVHERQSMAMDLRLGGASLLDIGLRLAADPAINKRGIAFPSGYGWQNYVNERPSSREMLAASAGRDIRKGLELVSAHRYQSAEELRDLEVLTLNEAQKAIMPAIIRNQSHWHVLRLIQLSEQRMKLLGLEASSATDENARALAEASERADGINPAVQPEWSLENVTTIFETAFEAGMASREEVDEIIASVKVDDDVVDAEVVDEADVDVDVEHIEEDAEEPAESP